MYAFNDWCEMHHEFHQMFHLNNEVSLNTLHRANFASWQGKGLETLLN